MDGRRGQPGGAEESASLVRPYILTAGRTEGRIQLALEALIDTVEAGPEPRWSAHDVRAKILGLGVESASVAEIAARLSLPLGVTRVLIGDLVTQGYVRVQDTLGETSSFDERRELIGRTLRGLRAL